ncbi:MAG: hypothetical protein WCN88_04940 [Candidatus Falkowbacteria bacterium]
MQNSTIKIHAFAGALSQHICAVNNFTHYGRKWLKANTTENCEAVADTITPNKTVTAVMAVKDFSVKHMSYLKNLLTVLTSTNHSSSNQGLQDHQKILTVIKEFVGFGKNCTVQLNTLTVALDDLLKVVGTV